MLPTHARVASPKLPKRAETIAIGSQKAASYSQNPCKPATLIAITMVSKTVMGLIGPPRVRSLPLR